MNQAKNDLSAVDNTSGAEDCECQHLGISDSPTISIEGNGSRESHLGDGYKESDVMYTLNTIEQHGVCYGFQGQAGATVDMPILEEATPTMVVNQVTNVIHPQSSEPILLESNQNHATIQTDGVSTTLPASMGEGGGYVPMVTQEGSTTVCAGFKPGQSADAHGLGYEEEVSVTLSTSQNQAVVCPKSSDTPVYAVEPGAASRVGGHVTEDVAPTLRADMGDNQTAVVVNVETEVSVRKYEVDIPKLIDCLQAHRKNMSIKKLVEALDKPKTLVEHWFRKDKYFAIPDADIWLQLKELLKIDTDEFDKSIMTFETKPGVYDTSNRIHMGDVAPTLVASGENTMYCVEQNPVVYGISSYDSNAMKSDNPNSGIYKADTARTLDLNGGNPACNQGGMAVVQAVSTSLTDSEKRQVEDWVDAVNSSAVHQQDLIQSDLGVARTLAPGTHASGPHLTKTLVTSAVMDAPDKESNCLNPWDVQSKHIQPEDGIAESLYAAECRYGGGESYVLQNTNPAVAFTQNEREEVRDLQDVAGALSAEPGTHQQTYVAQTFKKDSHAKSSEDGQGWVPTDINDTLNAFDSGETRTPTLVVETPTTYQETTGALCAAGYSKLGTQEAMQDMFVVQSMEVFHCTTENDMVHPLKARDYKDPQIVAYSVDMGGGKSSCSISEEQSPTLATTHGGEPVVYCTPTTAVESDTVDGTDK